MFETARAIGANQISRQIVTTQRAPTLEPRQIALEGLRRRNAWLDAVFYDVGVISSDEASSIAPWLAREGAIVITPPSGQGNVTLCASIDDFVARGGAQVSALAIAGVGSSALGSAAFARNVADAIGAPVAAVVSGYGLADLATEAMGGFFFFGELNSIRHSLEFLDTLGVAYPHQSSWTVEDAVRESRDTQTVLALLTDARLNFRLLTGHSKGNLVLSEALYELRDKDRERLKALAAGTNIVTVSATIAMPPAFKEVVDVIGEWDWFGGINSRSTIKPDVVVPRAWHHTNTDLSWSLNVTETFREIFRGRLPPLV